MSISANNMFHRRIRQAVEQYVKTTGSDKIAQITDELLIALAPLCIFSVDLEAAIERKRKEGA